MTTSVDPISIRNGGPLDRPRDLSAHAHRRLAQRCRSVQAVDYVLEHGLRLRRTGVEFCFLRGRDIPPADRRAVGYLEGTVVLIGDDGVAITVYRNRRALAEIRRKAKYRRCFGWRGHLAAG
jgi:hypothetical protein